MELITAVVICYIVNEVRIALSDWLSYRSKQKQH